ncbi:MAG: hypothetical protein FIB08_11660 [Candidatus Methanoperedens sp.]|nr:hypothetical protein [Candidatus Methanoperedens sp.]
MDWKEFLKPEKRKIFITVSIPASMAIGMFVMGNIDSSSLFGIVLGTFFGMIFFLGLLSISIFSTIFKAFGIDPFSDMATGSAVETMSSSVSILSIIPWWYILSCIIVFAYGKRYFSPLSKT